MHQSKILLFIVSTVWMVVVMFLWCHVCPQCVMNSHDIFSMWRTDGHCHCFGWIQQHLSLASNDWFPPEINSCTWHWAPKYPGNVNITYINGDEALCNGVNFLSQFFLVIITDIFSYNLFLLQVSVIQYGVQARFEFQLNKYKSKTEMVLAASKITQLYGELTNTFQAIKYARLVSWLHYMH